MFFSQISTTAFSTIRTIYRQTAIVFPTKYQDWNYNGGSIDLALGTYDYNYLVQRGFNDRISSIKVPNGLKAVMYEHANRGGRSKTFTSDAQWIGDDFNDIISHIEVSSIKKSNLIKNDTFNTLKKSEQT